MAYGVRIYFMPNGGTGGPDTQYTESEYTQMQVTIVSSVPTRSGYTFLGWSTSETATSASFQPGSTYYFSYGTHILYAVWGSGDSSGGGGSTTTYTATVYFDANGGSGGPSSASGSNTASTVSVTIPNTIPTRSGYTFLGWSYSNTATSATFSPGSSYYFSSGTHYLYAVWQSSGSGGTTGGGGGAYVVDYNYNWRSAVPYVVDYNYNWRAAKAYAVDYNYAWRTL